MKGKIQLLLLFLGVTFSVYSADFYWIGGDGNWNDASHWAPTSGGTAGATLPSLGDNVYIDNNSGAAGFTITIDGNVAVDDIHIQNTFVELLATGRTINCRNLSVTDASSLALTNCTVDLTGSSWDIQNNPTLSFTNTTINILNPLAFLFNGGGMMYNDITSQAATLTIEGSNVLSVLKLAPFSLLEIENGSILTIDSLAVTGDCNSHTQIQTTDLLGTSASIQKAGYQNLSAAYLYIDNVNAITGAFTYSLSKSTVNRGLGWQHLGQKYYWIGDQGNWSDLSHWSLSSGGIPATCLPAYGDSVIFDNNSFSLLDQEVNVDVEAYFSFMDWTDAINTPIWNLDTSVFSNGDIILNPDLIITRNDIARSIEFTGPATLNTKDAFFDCNVSINTMLTSDLVNLGHSLTTSDSAGIYISNGTFSLDNYDLQTDFIIASSAPGTLKSLNLTTSSVTLFSGFDSEGATGFTFNAGSSNLFIGDTLTDSITRSNYLITSGLTFNKVTLDFRKNSNIQRLAGSNTFNELNIQKNSDITIDSTVIQTIVNNLNVNGTCKDSVHLTSSASAIASIFNISTTATVNTYCVNFTNIAATGTLPTTYFSRGTGTTTGWTLSSTPAVTSSFTVSGGYCLGDTTHFTNNSSVFGGDPNNLTSRWYFRDESTGYFEYLSPTDSIFISYESDTSKHVFLSKGDFKVYLEAINNINFCVHTDTVLVSIKNPSVQLISSNFSNAICKNDTVTFEVSSDAPNATFLFYVNGFAVSPFPTTDTTYMSTTLSDDDTVSVRAFEGSCVSTSLPKIGIKVNDLPDFSLLTTPVASSICANDNITITPIATDPTYIYQYLLNGDPVSLGASYSNTTLQDQDVVTVVARDTNICRDTLFKTYTVNPLPTPSLATSITNNVICAGAPVTFTASNAALYEFFVDNVSQGTPSAVNTWSSSSLNSGEVITVVGYSASGCFQASTDSYSYTVNALPTIELTSSELTTICSGTDVQFSVTGGAEYEFFINGTSVQGPSSTNTYNSTTLNNNDDVHVLGSFSGCENTSSHLVFNVGSAPTTTLSSTAVGNKACNNSVVDFTATGATNYEFFINGVSQGTPSVTNTFSTSSLLNGQTVSVTGESNNCFVSKSIPITILPTPSVSTYSSEANNTVCEGESITFTGVNSATYELFVDGSSYAGPQASSSFATTLSNGSHSVYIIGTAANGCSSASQNTINATVNPIPTVNLTSTSVLNEICSKESVTFTGLGATMYQFFIDGNSQGSLSLTNTFTTPDLQDGQTITVLGNSLGCTNTSSALVFTVHPSPTVSLSNSEPINSFCEGTAAVFTATGATNYQFFVNGVSQGAPSATSTLNAAGFTAGSYPVKVTGEQSGCSDSVSVSITVNPLPTAAIVPLGNGSICSGEAVTYQATGGSLYEFFVNGTTQGSPTTLNLFSSSTLNNGDVLSVEVSTLNSCKNSATASAITVISTPVVLFGSSDADNTICENDAVTFTASGATSYEFFINMVSQGSPSASNTLSTSLLNDGDIIEVTGNKLGCPASSAPLTFTVHPYPVVSLVNNGNTQVCESEALNLNATGATLYQYFINNVPVGPYSVISSYSNSVNDNDVVTVKGSLNGCESSAPTSIQYTVLQYPTIATSSSNPTNIICKDEMVTIQTSGASKYTYELNDITVQSGLNGSFSTNTLIDGDEIKVTGYNGHCASITIPYLYVVNEMNLTLTASPDAMICKGSPVTLAASGADEYEFFLNGVSQGSASTTNTLTLSQVNDLDEVTFIGKSNTTLCYQDNGNFIILDVMDTPTITANSSYEFCEGDSVILRSNSTYGNQWVLDGMPIPNATDSVFVAYETGVYSLNITHGGNGNIWSFGDNASGVFGDSSNFNNILPTEAKAQAAFVSLSSGADFVLGVTATGTVYSWGKNTHGQLGNGSYTSINTPKLVPSLSSIASVATAEKSSVAVTLNGDVYVWGENNLGQLGTGNTSVINFPYLNNSIANVDTIAGGKNHFLLLKDDGTVWTVGNNASGQLGIGNLSNSLIPIQVTGLSNIVFIGAGERSSFAIDNTGNLFVWGANESGQLGLGDNTNRLTPSISTLKKIRSAIGGAKHSAFMATNGEVYTTGNNVYGQLGTTDFSNRQLPYKLGLTGVTQISIKQNTTLVRRTDGSVFGFGDNVNGQLSTVPSTKVNTPTHIENLNGVTFIGAGRVSTHAILGHQNTCSSTNLTVVSNSTPSVVVNINNDFELTASVAGVAYQWYLNGLEIPGANQLTYIAIADGNYSVKVTSASGCSSRSEAVTISILALDDNSDEFHLIGFPNPTNGIYNLRFDDNFNGEHIVITLFDDLGRKVKEVESVIQANIQISLADLAKGNYQLKVTSFSFEKVLRVIKLD